MIQKVEVSAASIIDTAEMVNWALLTWSQH